MRVKVTSNATPTGRSSGVQPSDVAFGVDRRKSLKQLPANRLTESPAALAIKKSVTGGFH